MTRVEPALVTTFDGSIGMDLRQRVADTLTEKRVPLVRFIQSKVENVDVAEDILHDVVYQILRAADASEAIEDVTAWMYHAAKNRIIDWYRKRKPERMTDQTPDIRSDVSPESEFTQVLQWDAFVDALAELPENQRAVFVMHELEGRSFEEIREITGEKLNTLLSRKRYAVLALRKMLQQHYDDLS